MRSVFCLLVLAMSTALCADAATITVRKDGTGDYAVIQAALDVAAAGDTVLIGPGEFLEHSTVRFPAWSWDIESYANVTVDNLTIIGAGSDQTLIGPAVYSGQYSSASPEVITYIGGGDLSVSDLCVRNTYEGIRIVGRLFMNRCVAHDNYINVKWEAVGSGGWIRDSQFDVATPNYPIAIDIVNTSGAADILVENCSVQHSLILVDGVAGVTFRDCQLSSNRLALQFYGNAQASIDRCVIAGASAGIELTAGSSAICEVRDSEISGVQAALGAVGVGCRFIVSNTRLVGGSYATLFLDSNAGPCAVSGCDLQKGIGPMVRCGLSGPVIAHDFRNNYWGTTDEATIQSWIMDHNDDPSIGATVLYTPFAGQSVPAETTTWGDLKALFR